MKRCLLKTGQIFKPVKKEDWAAVAAIIGMYGMMGMMGITCPILFMTGISCAGCGMTRAWLSLFRLDFGAAFYYHPLFWLPALLIVLFLFEKEYLSNGIGSGQRFFCSSMAFGCLQDRAKS